MKVVDARVFQEALHSGGLRMADAKVGIGRELSYLEGPARTVVVQFSGEDPVAFRVGVADRVLRIADTWFLFPRYDTLPTLGLLEVNDESSAIEFEAHVRYLLAEYLATRPLEFGKPGLDLYAVARDGQTLITWDHHTEGEGLSVQLQRVDDANALVSSLCAFGSEFEVFSKEWGDGASDV